MKSRKINRVIKPEVIYIGKSDDSGRRIIHHAERLILNNQIRVIVRPANLNDCRRDARFLTLSSTDAKRFRFFGPLKHHKSLINYAQIKSGRELTLVAVTGSRGKNIIAIVQLFISQNQKSAEFAIIVADPWQRQGLGTAMMARILDMAERGGIRRIYAYTLPDNTGMLQLFKWFGFTVSQREDMYRVELEFV